MGRNQDKFLLDLLDGMENIFGEYDEIDMDADIKEQEKIQDVTGNYEFWGLI